MTPGVRRLYAPRRVTVDVDREGVPLAVEGVAVAAIREEWVVEDRWWALRRLWRHYFELVLADGQDLVVFRSSGGRWFRQRA
jgi:S-adenosylhomocysteine hydrolase